MGLEAGTTTIAGLNKAWPLGTDFVLEGDDHLRIIKDVLKTTFPGSGGQGFASAITATETELNYVSGATSNIQAQIDSIVAASGQIPSGTVMAFFQASAPVGWTQVTTHTDKMLRVVDGTGGGSGGTDSPIAADMSHVHSTGNHTLTKPELPAHTHLLVASGTFSDPNLTGANAIAEIRDTGTTGQDYTLEGKPATANLGESSNVGNSQPHNHGDTGSAGPTFTPKYIDMILASKD